MRYACRSRALLLIGLSLIMILAFAMPAAGEEAKAGAVINAKNIDEMKPKTFEGKTIASMLTDKIEWWIRNHNLTLTLKHSEPYPVDPRWIEATKKYSGDVTFDPNTREAKGYKAGLAFPNITDDDPHKADKLMWNLYLTGGWSKPSFQQIPLFRFVFIDGRRGFEQSQTWTFQKVWMVGNLAHPDGPVLGDGSIYYKNLIMALEPTDIRGVGSFSIRYTDGRPDDAWVYAKSVRRTRRLSGGGWFDPIGGTDQLQDEVSVYSPYPAWYPEYKYLGSRFVLSVANASKSGWNPGAANEYPTIDMNTPPYWNPIDEWEPREVFVVEATMPREHVYSRRVYYIDREGWLPIFCESYDKKGDFVKLNFTTNMVEPGLSHPSDLGVRDPKVYAIDWRRMHCTIAVWGDDFRRNPPLGPDAITVGTMEAVARGQYRPPSFPDPDFEYKPMYMKDFDVDWSTYKLK
jgi:hypothetical protein